MEKSQVAWNKYMDAFTYIRDDFGFHEKWTKGKFRDFSRQRKWCQAPAQHYKSRRLS